ncbi:MAG: hypothetical protein GYA35_03410, partial [Thermoanaerobaculaceae bacterium]|nr:hypothetical protein [Thermoanaerobaculaceae bacterium]
MKKERMTTFLLVVLFAVAVPLFSQELDPLLKILIEKNILTQDEAVSVQEEYDKRKREESVGVLLANEEKAKKNNEAKDFFNGLKIGGIYFISFQNGRSFNPSTPNGYSAYSKFVLKRGYFDVRKEISPFLKIRFTPDLTEEQSGEYKMRMKFCYADFVWKGNGVVTDPHVEVGMVHFPWFDIEETINTYRMQDAPFLDRIGVATTADLGLLFGANFGGHVNEEYQRQVSSSYPGKWGSFEIGIYNGGGFISKEKNSNKVVAGRLSLRVVPEKVPGLQFHWFFVNGRGNLEENLFCEAKGVFFGKRIYPKWNLQMAAISFQHSHFNILAECFEGEGNLSGTRYYSPD